MSAKAQSATVEPETENPAEKLAETLTQAFEAASRAVDEASPVERAARKGERDAYQMALGNVENYGDLKRGLERAGHGFDSDTDTEVVPHLVEEYREEGLSPEAAFRRTVRRLEGSYAVAMVVDGTDAVYATRSGSPLVMGVGDDRRYLASDAPAFLNFTDRVIYLEDGDVVVLEPGGHRITDLDGNPVERPPETVDWVAEDAEKGGYDHYMLKEIHEQPRALRQAIAGRIGDGPADTAIDLEMGNETLREIDEIQFVACGTSAHAGQYAARLLEAHADVPTSVTIASEYLADCGRDPERTLVIAVTQSGETADTLEALRSANRAGAHTLAVTNTLGSTVTRAADAAVFIKAGPEIGVAATKTFASQVATLALLTVRIGRERGTLTADRAETLLDDLHRLPGAVQEALDREGAIQAAAETFTDSEAFFFVGRRLGHPVALEGALKLKEISYDHAEGFAAGELKHGPLALVTPDTPVIAVMTAGTEPDATLNNVKEVEARGAPVIGVTSYDEADPYLDRTLNVPPCGEFEPLVAGVELQLFAYHLAKLKGRSIDKPRNLAKSVTVE